MEEIAFPQASQSGTLARPFLCKQQRAESNAGRLSGEVKAITWNGTAKVEVNVTFTLYEARRMATAVLAYLHAWDVLRMVMHQQIVGQPTPSNGKIASPANSSSMVEQSLKYGNGTMVDGENLIEVQTYRQYLAEKQSAPTSKTALLDFYCQWVRAVVG